MKRTAALLATLVLALCLMPTLGGSAAAVAPPCPTATNEGYGAPVVCNTPSPSPTASPTPSATTSPTPTPDPEPTDDGTFVPAIVLWAAGILIAIAAAIAVFLARRRGSST